MNFNKDELVNMIFVLGETEKNCLLASRIYATRFPESRHPDEKSFRKLLNRFIETGNVKYKKQERTKPIINEENELSVLLTVTEHPHISQNGISQATGISERSVQRILKKNHFHAYHIQLHQELSVADFERRAEFCNWARLKIQEDPMFFSYVLFSDEATFHKNGCVNRHNFHYYSVENPRLMRQIDHQHRWSLNVWGGIIGNTVIGPYFFNGHLNGPMYLDFLQHQLPGLLQEVPLYTRNRMWLQQDGAPAHFSRDVREYLNGTFTNTWIGRNGPTNWPARSPDLTKLDFFLWGHVKGIVYNDPPTTVINMQQRIRDAFASISPQMLRRVERSFQERVNLCIDENGRHIEHLL